jgi:hypothetical protein
MHSEHNRRLSHCAWKFQKYLLIHAELSKKRKASEISIDEPMTVEPLTVEPLTVEPPFKKLETDLSMSRTAVIEATKYTAGAVFGGIGSLILLAC